MLEDPRMEPQYGERVPYVVATGAPGARLIDRCVAPEALLSDPHLELDAEYYISKNLIPPLERIFNLVGANIRQWYDEMPKYQRMRRVEGALLPSGRDQTSLKKTLESYMKSSSCIVCRGKLVGDQPVCDPCLEAPHKSLLSLRYRLVRAEKKAIDVHKVCRSCMGIAWGDEVVCDSKDCPVFYSRTKLDSVLRSTKAVVEPVARIIEQHDDALDGEGQADPADQIDPLSW
jgi:DNA polymerase zeta